MTNEEFVRRPYAIAEVKDIAVWVVCVNGGGVFVDELVGVSYRGPSEAAKPVENDGDALVDVHRELYETTHRFRGSAGTAPEAPRSLKARQFGWLDFANARTAHAG
jgi:hypothetical protein